jgi:tRNA1(Val) A37 N6-methylase TrmN6
MKRVDFNSYISQSDFVNLFNELGWNHVSKSDQINPVTVDSIDYNIKPVADKQGFKVLTCHVAELPQHSIRKKIDTQLRRYFHNYMLIFILKKTEHHLWMIPVKTVEKRDLVIVEYADAGKADFLFSKINDFSFAIDEDTTIIDVTQRVHKAFEVNSAKITKDFYAGFRKQHNSFADFIKGINVDGDKQWYASVMLNRLMFCYFIQKKGFLNFDEHYLRNKLAWTKEQKGDNRFFGTFYKGFLSHLFSGGLNSPKHDKDFERIYGRIPYLNGGMFDEHELECQYKDIDIPDDAFESLFDFFDKWCWHLDTRITATGKDINPDVLGYIFEQYINDRAQMGAYYTKEDITEYIGKNCILPFLMDEVTKTSSKKLFTPGGYVWETLRNSGDSYIYDAVKKGMEYKDIPSEVAIGLDTTQPNLLERRKEWNKPTPDAYALPTEIWRETIERRNRYTELLNKIRNGEITKINDFITYNLDIRRFVEELLFNTGDHLFILHFYKVLQNITILDPTCGSGAFLFAALNILEPLYEICISRMHEFNATNSNLFKEQLEEIDKKYRSNIQYFIYKSIILRNLYGVDIMHEATEIARLRLFLKIVAVVDVDRRADNLGLDPLPDIDFNIRCGNTLIGYATEEELNNDLSFAKDIFEELSNQEFKKKIEDEMEIVSQTYTHFKSIQLNQHEDITAFRKAKDELSERLKTLNNALNQRLHKACSDLPYDEWLKSYQPFHWVAEFYQIIKGNEGFDVIIGNPPYVEYNKKLSATKKSISDIYKIRNYTTENCNNLYAFVSERATNLIHNCSFLGMIVPISIICTQRMQSAQNVLFNNKQVWLSNYSERPSKLFTGAEVLLSIYIINNSNQKESKYGTGFTKWKSIERNFLFKKIAYNLISINPKEYILPKIASDIENGILSKIISNKILGLYFTSKKNNPVYYRIGGGRYWKIFTDFSPKFILNERTTVSSRENLLFFDTKSAKDSIISVLSSSLFYWYFVLTTNCRDLNPSDLKDFPFSCSEDGINDRLSLASKNLMKDYNQKSLMKMKVSKKTGDITYQEFYPKLSKLIIDEIDKILSKHYGFTEEELDFIINYDIKYRMGDELTEED